MKLKIFFWMKMKILNGEEGGGGEGSAWTPPPRPPSVAGPVLLNKYIIIA